MSERAQEIQEVKKRVQEMNREVQEMNKRVQEIDEETGDEVALRMPPKQRERAEQLMGELSDLLEVVAALDAAGENGGEDVLKKAWLPKWVEYMNILNTYGAKEEEEQPVKPSWIQSFLGLFGL